MAGLAKPGCLGQVSGSFCEKNPGRVFQVKTPHLKFREVIPLAGQLSLWMAPLLLCISACKGVTQGCTLQNGWLLIIILKIIWDLVLLMEKWWWEFFFRKVAWLIFGDPHQVLGNAISRFFYEGCFYAILSLGFIDSALQSTGTGMYLKYQYLMIGLVVMLCQSCFKI